MPRYAAIDIGSNSLRMQVAETVPGAPPQVLAADRLVTRLGAGVFSGGAIAREAMELVSATLKRMAETYAKLNVSGVRAVATSAARDAANQREFLERASEALGAPVEVISGQEEARLIQLGVESLWPHPAKRILILDIGGGSAELIVSEHGRMAAAYSKPLGALRLTEVFLKSDPPAAAELDRLNGYIDEKLAPVSRRLGHGAFHRLIATSATAAAVACAVNRVHREKRDAADRLRATTPEVSRLFQELSRRDLAARRKFPGIGPRRAEIIVAGTAVLLRVLRALARPSMYYSMAGVRDGIIADLAARNVGAHLSRLDRDQRRTVEDMARRFGVDVNHARKVADLANTLFEALQPLHGLAPAYGKLLDAACFLHDTGHYISDTGHHRHSHYIVANSDLAGFTGEERQLIAMLCRFHRKSMPSARHEAFHELKPDARRAVLMLAPLVRLADSLDRSHDQRVERLDCQLRDASVLITLASAAGTDLEIWAGERAGEVFREVYGRKLVLERRAPGAERRQG